MFQLLKFLFLFLTISCVQKPDKKQHSWFGMDTRFVVTIIDRKNTHKDKLFSILEKETGRLEQVFNDYDPASGISAMSGDSGTVIEVSEEIYKLLEFSIAISRSSHGVFNINLHRLKALWGLGSGDKTRVPSLEEIQGAIHYDSIKGVEWSLPIDLLGCNKIRLRFKEVKLDLGAVVKGYTADRLSALLDSIGQPDHLVVAGGEIRIRGRKPDAAWTIGIRNPRSDNPNDIISALNLEGSLAVSTSGDYERYFIKDGIRYHHIFDPRTGYPAQGFCSVSVLGKSVAVTDALSTALFILGPYHSADLLKKFSVDAMWIQETSKGLCGILTPGFKSLAHLNGMEECPNL